MTRRAIGRFDTAVSGGVASFAEGGFYRAMQLDGRRDFRSAQGLEASFNLSWLIPGLANFDRRSSIGAR